MIIANLESATVCDNTAPVAAGVYASFFASAYNSIIWNNTPTNVGAEETPFGRTVSFYNCCTTPDPDGSVIRATNTVVAKPSGYISSTGDAQSRSQPCSVSRRASPASRRG